MAPATIIAPLTNSQKLFLQRLLVAHVLTDDNAKQLYQSIKEGFADVAPSQEEEDEEGGGRDNGDQGYMGNNFEHCLGIINASLVPAFNLEVGTVSLPPPFNADNDDEQQQQPSSAQKSPGGRKRTHLVKYHAIVNRSNDGIAQSHAFPLSKGGPHEMAYFRLALEKMVERGIELMEDESSPVDAGVGCPGTLNRMELINLRTEMEGNHKDKLTIRQTECALEVMEVEGWVVRVAPPAEEDSDEEEEENEEDDDEDEEAVGRPKRRRKKPSKGTPSSGGSRRKSLKGTFYGIGPRSFMELGDFLQKAGLPGDRMPQSILHAL